ncbi:MAG: ATP-binding protein [Planctomycetes bacterium]|nr:ATP-binding protein [Planctomycetota bacterium]
MAMISGPRQVGKTTTCKGHANFYVNWDNIDDRRQILAGPSSFVERLGLNRLMKGVTRVLFDELHKYPRWKQFLKGFFDTYADQIRILVTGSSRMDTYRRGGDSLMGRFFSYRMHPFTIAEISYQNLPDTEHITRPSRKISEDAFKALWVHGGYPEPFIKRDARFSNRWQSLRIQQLLREDVHDFTQIHQLAQLETLVKLLQNHSSRQLIYSTFSRDIQVTVDTIKRWINALCSLHLGFVIRPWFKNISRSLRKEPKWFLRDWAAIENEGNKAETFVACHLLKAVEGWTDMGLGRFQLCYLRNKEQKEVDFVVIRDEKPWFLVEVKLHDESIHPYLRYYQTQLGVPFAFQVVVDANYIDADCFASTRGPIVVPAKTFLSQLL